MVGVTDRLLNRLPIPLRQLRWKLTLSYTIVTVGALLAVELALIIGGGAYLMVNSRLTPRLLIQDMNTNLAPAIRPYLSGTSLDVEMLWLKRFHGLEMGTSPIPFMGNGQLDMKIDSQLDTFLISADGTLLDTWPRDLMEDAKVGRPFDVSAIPGLEEPLQAALLGEDDYRHLYFIHRPDNKLVAAVPIFDKAGKRVLGALVFTTDALPWSLWSLGEIVQQVGYSLLFLTLFAGAMGTVFGSLTARGLVRRLKGISESTDAWSRGDFSVFVDDPSGDEIGRLADDLNHMAEQLEDLLNRRQEMSVMEERNRLARDLHDSAKQQAFAASAQLGAALARWKEDSQAAETHLLEAEMLIDEVRQELTHLIQELHPTALKGKGLAAALREFAFDWANHNDTEVDVRVQGERPLPLEVERTLFRIAQEALANAARHSQTQSAEILLVYNADSVTLTVLDNGRGFDTRAKQGGLGLRSMRERAGLLRGNLVIKSLLGAGTRVSVECPG